MSGTELSRVRTEFRLPLLEPINKSPLESSGAGVVMQSCGFRISDYGPAYRISLANGSPFSLLRLCVNASDFLKKCSGTSRRQWNLKRGAQVVEQSHDQTLQNLASVKRPINARFRGLLVRRPRFKRRAVSELVLDTSFSIVVLWHRGSRVQIAWLTPSPSYMKTKA